MAAVIYHALKYGHLIGMAILIGSFALEVSPVKKNLKKQLYRASFLSLCTGIAMVGLKETILSNSSQDIAHLKIAIKLIATIIIIWLCLKDEKPTQSMIKMVGLFSLGITAIALFWT